MATLAIFASLASGGTAGDDTSATEKTSATSSVRPDPPAGSDQGARAAAIRFTTPTGPNPKALRAFYSQHPDWKACGNGAGRCASVRVPVDYADPTGATVKIALHKVAAGEPGERRGTLFINPGGPGESGIDFAREAGSVFGPHVLARYDVVGFDPRGLGESGGFECLTDADLDEQYAADPTPETPVERSALEHAAAKRVAGCLRRGGDLARHMGTESVARDLDIMRDAVGDERLNYYGVSYGTLIGAVYADLFDTRVGLMVLDSSLPPDGGNGDDPSQADIDGDARDAAHDFESSVDAFVADCIKNDPCALGRNNKEAVATIVKLIDSLEQRPLPADVESLPKLTQGWATLALSEGLADEELWGDLQDALESALDGDGTDLAYLAMDAVYRDDDGSYAEPSFAHDSLPITCADWPPTAWDRAQPSADVLTHSPLWARLWFVRSAPCAAWTGPVRSSDRVGTRLPTPVLVIGNERDVVTPIGNTQAMAGAFAGSRFVTVDADGHGALDNGNSCADKVIDDYLGDGIPPADDFDCAKD